MPIAVVVFVVGLDCLVVDELESVGDSGSDCVWTVDGDVVEDPVNVSDVLDENVRIDAVDVEVIVVTDDIDDSVNVSIDDVVVTASAAVIGSIPAVAVIVGSSMENLINEARVQQSPAEQQ